MAIAFALLAADGEYLRHANHCRSCVGTHDVRKAKLLATAESALQLRQEKTKGKWLTAQVVEIDVQPT
jgi:hypothetical protein